MLISFTVENFLSFKDRVEFSMKKASKSPAGIEKVKDGVLNAACIYGANDSGKTNLLKAIQFVLEAINVGDVSHIYESRYSFVPNDYTVSKFELCFRQNKHVYKYVLECNMLSVSKEELYCDNKTIFKRSGEEITDYGILADMDYYSHRMFSKSSLFLSKLYIDNVLYEKDLKHQRFFQDVANWFRSVVLAYSDDANKTVFYNYVEPEDIRVFGDVNGLEMYLQQFLPKINSEITGAEWGWVEGNELKEISLSVYAKFGEKAPEGLFIRKNDNFFIWKKSKLGVSTCKKLSLFRNGALFETSWLSEGIKKIIELSLSFFLIEFANSVVLIDDLDARLHPLMVRQLLQKSMGSTRQSQLITTLHNINLIGTDLWRVDQIWFAHRKPESGTDLYSLQRFSPRFDKDVLKEYTKGVYGAIPNYIL